MHRLIFEHIIRTLILEVQSQERQIRDKIVALDKNKLRAPSKDIRRVFFTPGKDKEFDKEKAADYVAKLIKKKFPEEVSGDINLLPPGKGLSSEFYTLNFEFDGKEVSIVVASGIVAGKEEEERQVANINKQLEGRVITLQVNGLEESYQVDGFRRIEGNKKADFAFTLKGNDVLFVQHKSNTHQQMSGTDRFSRVKIPELDTFINKVKREVKKSPDKKLQTPVYTPIEDEAFAIDAVYGPQDDSVNGVKVYAVGDIKLTGDSDTKTLTAQKLYTYPTVPDKEDAPVLGATYRKDRSQYEIPTTRFRVYPLSYMKNGKKI